MDTWKAQGLCQNRLSPSNRSAGKALFPQLTLCSDLAPLVGAASPGGAAAGAAAGFTADTEGEKHISQKWKPGRKSPEVKSTFELLV